MTENVHYLDDGRVRLLAASNAQQVVVDGRIIPRLSAIDHGDQIEFFLDGRMSFSFPAEWSRLVAAAMAQSLAIGAGFANLAAESADRPFAPEVMFIDGTEDE